MYKPWSLNLSHSSTSIAGALVLPLLWLVLGTPLVTRAGTQTVHEVRPVAAEGRISIECLAGVVTVTGSDKSEVSIDGTIPDYCKLEVAGSENHLRVAVKWPERHHRGHLDENEEAVLTILVPRGAEVSANTVSADIEASGVTGELNLESVSGNIGVSGTPKSIEVKSVSGDLKLATQTKRVTAESVSGDLVLDGPSGELDLSTVSGDMKIKGGDFEKVRATAVSGEIRFDGNVAAEGHLELSSHSGSVEVALPSSISADFQVETFSGDIDSDFGGRAHRTSRYAPGRTQSFTAGSGSAEIELSSFSGDVIIRKK